MEMKRGDGKEEGEMGEDKLVVGVEDGDMRSRR